MKKKILVAGGTGYIGSHTTVELQNAGYEVVIIDDLSNSNIEVLDGIEKITGIRPEFIQLDLKDKEGTRKALEAHPGIKGIILFAASKAVGESVQQPLKYYRNNIVTLVNLLEMMPEFNIEGIVFSSSCTVYGQPDPENLPVTENAPIKPAMSPYGNTKQINEEIIRDTIHAGAPFKSIILRYFNPIGAHPSAEIGELPNGVPQNLIPDGTCIRDYIHVEDLCRAHLLALEKLDHEIELVFNLGNGAGYSVRQVIDTVVRVSGRSFQIIEADRRPGDPPVLTADASKARSQLGWKTQFTDLETIVQSAWKFHINHPDGYED